MRLASIILAGAIGIIATLPAAAQYCGTFRKCPVTRMPASERCLAFYRVSADAFSADEVAPIEARC